MYQEIVTLTNGVQVPQLALGTWMIDDDKAAAAVKAAVELGYRHVDTAQAYANEAGVGEGIRSCGVRREDLFVTTKVAAEHKDYKSAAEGIDESLRKMGLDYIDDCVILGLICNDLLSRRKFSQEPLQTYFVFLKAS